MTGRLAARPHRSCRYRMVEGRSSFSFSLETSQCLGVSGDVIGKKLQGDKPVQGYILGLVHYAHPTTAQLLDDAVVRNGLTNHAQGCYGGNMRKSMKAGELAISQKDC